MIACDRLVETNRTDRRHELRCSRSGDEDNYQATPFASAAIARANGGFCFQTFELELSNRSGTKADNIVGTNAGVADDFGFAFSIPGCRSV
jgi:hypothetical protein